MKKIFVFLCASLSVFAFAHQTLAACTVDGESVPCDELSPVAGTFLVIFAILVPLLIFGVIFGIVIAFIVFWVWMIVDAAQNEKENDLVAWILVLVFLSWIGAIVYYIARKRPRDKKRKLENVNKDNA